MIVRPISLCEQPIAVTEHCAKNTDVGLSTKSGVFLYPKIRIVHMDQYLFTLSLVAMLAIVTVALSANEKVALAFTKSCFNLLDSIVEWLRRRN